jgi:hypothetical protein
MSPSYKDVQAYAAKWLTADDIGSKTVKDKIVEVHQEKIRDPRTNDMVDKCVAEFEALEKDLILNKTNCETLEEVFGPDYDDWAGANIEVFTVKTPKGQGVRLRVLSAADTAPDSPHPLD